MLLLIETNTFKINFTFLQHLTKMFHKKTQFKQLCDQ